MQSNMTYLVYLCCNHICPRGKMLSRRLVMLMTVAQGYSGLSALVFAQLMTFIDMY